MHWTFNGECASDTDTSWMNLVCFRVAFVWSELWLFVLDPRNYAMCSVSCAIDVVYIDFYGSSPNNNHDPRAPYIVNAEILSTIFGNAFLVSEQLVDVCCCCLFTTFYLKFQFNLFVRKRFKHFICSIFLSICMKSKGEKTTQTQKTVVPSLMRNFCITTAI